VSAMVPVMTTSSTASMLGSAAAPAFSISGREGFSGGADGNLQGVAGEGVVLAPLLGAWHHKGRTACGRVGQSVATQVAPKFKPRLRRRGQHSQNTSCGDPAYHCMCSMQVIDITPMKHHLTSITSLRVVQQKHRRSKAWL
jgi:hypothetical protein